MFDSKFDLIFEKILVKISKISFKINTKVLRLSTFFVFSRNIWGEGEGDMHFPKLAKTHFYRKIKCVPRRSIVWRSDIIYFAVRGGSSQNGPSQMITKGDKFYIPNMISEAALHLVRNFVRLVLLCQFRFSSANISKLKKNSHCFKTWYT